MIEIKLKYGTKSVSKPLESPTTVRQVLADASAKAYLGYPESVQVLIDGAAVSLDQTVNHGDELVLERQAAAKAA